MGQIPPADLVLLRQPVDRQKSVERLYFFDMNWVWHGRVNEAPARGDRTITFDTGEMNDPNVPNEPGDFLWADFDPDLWAGLEVWFSATGYDLKDRGVRRLRTMTSADNGVTGTIDVDWHDEIDLANDDFITIKHFYPPWPKYSYFTAAGPVFYKDGPDGITYVASGDANDTPAPHVIMGRNYAGELTGASVAIQCDASDTVDVAGGGGAAGYLWALTPWDGADPFGGGGATATPTLTIDTQGSYWLHCTVTINARSTIAHRAVIVGGGLTEFARSPITSQYDKTDINVTLSLTSPETGATGAIRGVMDWTKVQDHTLAIITATDYYGSTQKTISYRGDPLAVDVYDDRQHIVFCGYLALENMDLVEDGSGRVELQAVSLVDMFLYSLSLTGVTAAGQWYEMINTQMTVAGNLLHLLRWHSTLLDIADWWLPWTDTVRRSANEEFSEGDMLERGRELARARLMGITANPQGEIFVETDLNLRNAVDRAAEFTTLTLTEADVAGSKRARTRRRGDSVRVLADGGYSTGVMGSFQPFFAASQNVAKAEARPALVHIDRLMFPTQAEANRVAARLAAVANRRYIEVDLDFSGNYREVFSPADQQWTNLGNLFAATLIANISDDTGLVSALCVPRQVTHAHDNASGQTTVSVIFDVQAPVELEGRTITPPAVPSEDPDDGTWDFPDIPEWPTIPDVTLLTNLLAFDSGDGCWLRFASAADWVERNGTRVGADDADLQGGWDPWWFTPAKHNTTDVNQSILWACQLGKIWRSIDGGQNWVDYTPFVDTDPTDDWTQVPAPTAENVTYIQRVDNIHANKQHIFLATYDDGGSIGSWLLKTDDDGTTWTWESLYPLVTSGGFYYAASVNSVRVANDVAFHPAGYNIPCWYPSIIGQGNMAGVEDDEFCVLEYDYNHHNGFGQLDIIVDFGVSLTTNAAGYVEIKAKSPWSAATTIFWSTLLSRVSNSLAGPWTNIGVVGAFAADGWGTHQLANTLTFRYYSFGAVARWIAGDHDDDGGIDAVRVANVASIGGDDTQVLWADVDSEDGTILWLTVWKGAAGGAGALYLQKRATTDLSLTTEYNLGTCSEAELAAGTYVAYPYTETFDHDRVLIFGRMNAPQGLANPEHIIRTTDGGATWSSVENTWGADVCGAFRTEGAAVPRQFYAVRNIAGAAAGFYSGPESLVYRSDLSFAAGVGVGQDALTINGAAQVAVGANAAGATMITIAEPPGYGTWTDITNSFPATGSVSSLTYV